MIRFATMVVLLGRPHAGNSESEKVVIQKRIRAVTYRYQEFPKFKYHPIHEPIIVQNRNEEEALGVGWCNSPADAKAAGETMDECRACGCSEFLHDELGCFSDATKRNRLCREDDSGEWPLGQRHRARQRLRVEGRMCWCPSFCADPVVGRELIRRYGNSAALRRELAHCIEHHDAALTRDFLRAYIARVPADHRDSELITEARLVSMSENHNEPAGSILTATDRSTASGNETRHHLKKKRKPSNQEKMRDAVMFAAIREGLAGIHYCHFLHNHSLGPPSRWVSDGCPRRYPEAYTASAKWRKRIQDEKHRATLRLRRLKEMEPGKVEELLLRAHGATLSTRH